MNLIKCRITFRTPFLRRLLVVLGSTAAFLCIATAVPAQTVESDPTVGTQVAPSPNRFDITGGTIEGTNLFHSFQDFSPQGWSTVFDLNDSSYAGSADAVSTIFSRISGGGASNINGLLQVIGGNSPDFFLLNPNGIVFGPNARLDIDGSFIGSTAESIRFADGIEFLANSTATSPLLTMNVPVGLQMGLASGDIQVNDAGYNLLASTPFTVDSSSSLQVKAGNTLALVGSNIILTGGTLAAPGGRVALGGVREGQVTLDSNSWDLNYNNVQNFGDISLSSQSLLDASQLLTGPTGAHYAAGDRGGTVQIQGRRLSFQSGSLALINNISDLPFGSISARASETIELSGRRINQPVTSGLRTLNFGSGTGGNFDISAQQLRLSDGARIELDTFGAAPSGSVSITTTDAVILEPGGTTDQSSAINSIKTFSYSTGAAGNVEITTDRLENLGGAITSESYRSGRGGDVTLKARQLRVTNGASVASGALGTGDGGDVFIDTNTLEVSGVNANFSPSFVTAGATNEGNAGSLTINTQQLFVREGGRIDSSTVASGNAGSVTINASESVEVSGAIPGSTPSLIISSANILDPSSRAFLIGLGLSLPDVPSGASGNVMIVTPTLVVSEGGQITVRNDGAGDAGALSVDADTIYLSRDAGITASTQQGNGGNISLSARERLLMRNSSRISAEAGGAGAGGNIAITTPVIVALANSDIIANAVQGDGGNVDITTGLLVGTQFRDQLTAESDITASSRFGLSGTVSVEGFKSDLDSGLVELPNEVIDSSEQIASGCSGLERNQFVASGRGGLPPTPENQPISRTWSDLRDLSTFRGQPLAQPLDAITQPVESVFLTEAADWVTDEQGQINLVAKAGGTEPVVPLATCTRNVTSVSAR